MNRLRLQGASCTWPVLLVCCALLGAACSRKSAGAKKAEWPEFRGPSQNGHSSATGLPTEWSPTKNIVWKTELPGRSWSSPIVAGDRIILTNAISANNVEDVKAPVSLHVLALDASSGKVLWDHEVFFIENPWNEGYFDKNSHASATPVYDEGRVYAQLGNFGTVCLDVDGNVIWKTKEPAFESIYGNGGCPIVVDDLLVFNCDAVKEPFVVALDKATGKVRWKTDRGRKGKNLYALSTPLSIEVNGVRQIITVGTRVAQALSPKDGKKIWHVFHDEYCAVPRPVFAHGLVFLSTGHDKANLLAIRPDGRGNVTDTHVVWRAGKNVSLTPSPLVVGDELYMVADNGVMTCLDAKTGALHWSERVGKTTSASPLYADGKIYVQDEFGKGYVLKPGHKLDVLATNDLGDKSLASYAVHGKHLLIRTQHAVWCVGEK